MLLDSTTPCKSEGQSVIINILNWDYFCAILNSLSIKNCDQQKFLPNLWFTWHVEPSQQYSEDFHDRFHTSKCWRSLVGCRLLLAEPQTFSSIQGCLWVNEPQCSCGPNQKQPSRHPDVCWLSRWRRIERIRVAETKIKEAPADQASHACRSD